MNTEIKNLKHQIALLEKEKMKLERYLKNLQSVVSEVESIKNSQIQNIGRLRDTTIKAFTDVASDAVVRNSGVFLKDNAVDSELRSKRLSFKNSINEIIKGNTSLLSKVSGLKHV